MNKITIVTGASKGIGRAIAEAFAAAGKQLVICSRNKEEIEKVADEIMALHPECLVLGVQADLSKKDEIAKFGKLCLEKGEPEILVNNTGTYLPGNVLEEEEGTLETLMRTNLYSAYHLCRIVGNEMKKNKQGHIFNISSIAGAMAYENGGSYSITKYAMNGLSANLRHELKNFGVKVTNVLPGAVMTDSWAGFDNSNHRIMEAADIAQLILAASTLSPQAVVEEITVRPQLGDL